MKPTGAIGMRRAVFAALLAGLVAWTGCAGVTGEPSGIAARRPDPSRAEARGPAAVGTTGEGAAAETAAFAGGPIPRFSRYRAMKHVRRLAADIGVRVRATRGERRGARYIAGRFRALGYRVNVQEFDVDSRRSRSIVAWWPDALGYPVVTGAHMDTVPRSPGANDNASGVAVMLEVARLVAGKRPARYIRFAAFGSEEYGRDGRHHVGSQVFVNRLGRRGRRRLGGMVSVDMIADGRPLIVGTAGLGPEVVARTLYRKVRNAGIGVVYRTTCDCSDNGPFERAGIPAAFMWSGTEPDYHEPSDTVANMSPRDLGRTGRALRAFAAALTRRLLERFREH